MFICSVDPPHCHTSRRLRDVGTCESTHGSYSRQADSFLNLYLAWKSNVNLHPPLTMTAARSAAPGRSSVVGNIGDHHGFGIIYRMQVQSEHSHS